MSDRQIPQEPLTFATDAAALRGEAEMMLKAMIADMERLGLPLPTSVTALLPTDSHTPH